MTLETDWDFVLRTSRAQGEITTLDDVTVVLEFAARREAGWPCSTVTGMYVGNRRLRYPIAAALIDHKLSTGMEPSEVEVTAICKTIQAEQRARQKKIEAWQTQQQHRIAAAEMDASRDAIRLGLFD